MISKINVNMISVGTKTARTSSEKFFASSLPPLPWSRCAYSGTKPAEKAPSPNRRRKVFGRRNATKKASACQLAPMTRDISISRAKPATRLTRVRPPIVPVDLMRFVGAPDARASGVAWARGMVAAALDASLLLHLRHVRRREVDRVEEQRREAAVADCFGDDLAGKREKKARGLDQKERLQCLCRNIAKSEKSGVTEVDGEMHAVVRAGRHFDLQSDLMDLVGGALDVDIELYVEVRLHLPLENLRSTGILDRQILGVLGQNAHLRCIAHIA